MNSIAIIQARMGSSRLPGKVILPIAGLPAIVHTYRRVRIAVPKTVVAIPAQQNDQLRRVLERHGVALFVWDGPEDDVLGRYTACAQAWRATHIIRITGDCPFIDPQQIANSLSLFCNIGFDLPELEVYDAHHVIARGFRFQILSMAALQFANSMATSRRDREHVWTWTFRAAYKHEHGFRPLYRWTLDTVMDYSWFRWISTVLNCTPPHPTARELLAATRSSRIPRHVDRR